MTVREADLTAYLIAVSTMNDLVINIVSPFGTTS